MFKFLCRIVGCFFFYLLGKNLVGDTEVPIHKLILYPIIGILLIYLSLDLNDEKK